MNLFNLEHLLIILFCIILAYLIAKYGENKSHLIWSYFNCAVGAWSLGSLLAASSKNPVQTILYWKFTHLSMTFIPILFYHFVCAYYELKRRNILVVLYMQGIISSSIILFTNLCFKNNFWSFNSFYYLKTASFLNMWWIIWCVIVICAFYEFITHIRTDKTHRVSSLIIFWAMLIGFAGELSNLLPVFGIMIYPGYQISIGLYALLITYGIFYHRLLPIDIVIKRSIIYSLLVAVISLTYLLIVLFFQKLFHQFFGFSSSIVGSFIIGIGLIPLKNKIQNIVDRLLLKATPMEIARENQQLRLEVAQSERMKSIAILASGMAHEIKNPLTPIKTFSEQLPSRLDDKEFLLKFSRIINKEVDRIDSLVQELLNFAKPAPPKLNQVNIQQLIEHILELLNNKIIHHKIILNTSFENKNILIHIDSQQIEQALLNIFLNAIDAMPDGGTLTIETYALTSTFPGVLKRGLAKKRSPPIFIPAFSDAISEKEGTYTIKITDSGCGIDPKDLLHIFDPFFTKKDHGTGLGLPITHEIIKNHNGRIFAESKLGSGTSFRIELPL